MTQCNACQRVIPQDLAVHGECPFCGVVFAKLRDRAGKRVASAPARRRVQPPVPLPVGRNSKWPQVLRDFLANHRLQIEAWGVQRSPWIRLPALLFMAYLSIRYLVNGDYRSIFDGINLGIHEAGHLLFAPFPTFLTFLGGTLTQLAAPLICGFILFRQEDYFGIAFCGTWLAANAYHVAIYQADAQAQLLPLVTMGGGVPIHDWHYMLNRLGLLSFDSQIAWLTRCAGFLIAWGSIAYGVWILQILREQDSSQSL